MKLLFVNENLTDYREYEVLDDNNFRAHLFWLDRNKHFSIELYCEFNTNYLHWEKELNHGGWLTQWFEDGEGGEVVAFSYYDEQTDENILVYEPGYCFIESLISDLTRDNTIKDADKKFHFNIAMEMTEEDTTYINFVNDPVNN